MPNWKKLIVSGSSAHLYNLNVASAVTASYFVGDGSGLTNVTTTVAELASITDNFTSTTSKVVTHNFNSKNVIVVAYSGDFQIIPSSIETTSNNTVTVTFDTPTTGHIVVSKGGHLLDGTITAGTLGGYSGSYYLDYNNHTNIPQGIVSSSRQLDTQISGSFNLVSASLASRISNISTDFVDIQNKPTLLSSSRQIASEISGSFSIVSASLASRISNISTDFADIQNKPTLLSSSRQIASEISGSFTLVSASFASTIGNLDNIYATDSQLNTVSGSFASTISNLDSIYATDNELTIVSGAFATTITNLSTSNVVEGTNLYYRDDRVKSKLNNEGVVSGSSQINVKNVQYYGILATTGSNTFNGDQTVNGDINVNGKLTATSFGYIFVSSSTIYTSGSTKFGDTTDDKHQFTGSVEIDGGLKVQYGINANWFHGDVDFIHLVNTPRLVSSSIQIGSEISGSFTAVSASFASTISNLDNIYATDIQLTAVSSSVATDIAYINNNFAFASNVNNISQSFAQTIGNLQYTYETITNVSQVSSSLASRIDGISTDFYDITNKPTLLSGSAQIASEISGSFTAVSASFANTISNLGSIYATDTELSNVSASFATFVSNLDSTYATDLQLSNVSASFATVISNLDNIYATDLQLTNVSASFATTLGNLDNNYATDLQLSNVSASLASSISNISTDWPDITNKPSNIISSSVQLYNSTLTGMIISGSFSGSYIGDGSGLTGVQTTVVQNATAYDTFTSATSKVITHNFGTKNVIVSVYDSNDAVIIPTSIITTDTNTVTLGFEYATTGRAVVAKGGHIVSGSLQDYTYREGITGSSSYTITHNLNEDFPVVQVYDTNKEQVIPAKVKSTSTNAVLIEFINSFTGTVVVKK